MKRPVLSLMASAQKKISSLETRLFLSKVLHLVISNGFALFYSFQLGPDRRSYVLTVFVLTLASHALIIHGSGLRLRGTSPKSIEFYTSIKQTFWLSILSIFFFLALLSFYMVFKQSFPISLLIVALFYYLASTLFFLTLEISYALRRLGLISQIESITSLLIILNFFLLLTFTSLTLAVAILLTYSFSYLGGITFFVLSFWRSFAGIILRFRTSLTVLSSLPSVLFGKYSRLTLINSFYERIDRLILVYILEPQLFAKFTLCISPLILYRVVNEYVSRLIILKQKSSVSGLSKQVAPLMAIYLLIGTLTCLGISQFTSTFQNGVWHIGLPPLLAFLFFELMRTLFSLRIAFDLVSQEQLKHFRNFVLVLPFTAVAITISYFYFPNNLVLFYLFFALLITATMGRRKLGQFAPG